MRLLESTTDVEVRKSGYKTEAIMKLKGMRPRTGELWFGPEYQTQ